MCGRSVYIKSFKKQQQQEENIICRWWAWYTWLSKTVLERNGFEVQAFESPISVLENFKPGSYDLLLIDIKMREMDGFELYDKLRKMDNNINVCFLTAAQEYYDKYKERYPWVTKECFIAKPISLKNLVNTINSVLN